MKKTFLLTAAALILALQVNARDLRGHTTTDSLSTNDFAIKPGGTYNLSVNFVNPSSMTYKGVTVYLNLPKGIRIKQNTATSGATTYSTMVCNGIESRLDATNFNFIAATGKACTVLYSPTGNVIPGHEGNLLNFTLECDSDVPEGEYAGSFAGSGFTSDGMESTDMLLPREYLADNHGTFKITVTNTPTTINNSRADNNADNKIYDVDGYEVKKTVKGRIYVVNGKKVLAK